MDSFRRPFILGPVENISTILYQRFGKLTISVKASAQEEFPRKTQTVLIYHLPPKLLESSILTF